MEPRPSDSRTATPKAIELGHVVVNVHTGVAARVRGFSPQFGPFDDEATVLVEIGRTPCWGREEEWLRGDVILASEWQRRKERERAEAEVEIAGIRTERRRRPDGLIRLIPRLGPWCRVDRRLRTAPHGDALDTSVRPDPLAELRMAIKVGRLRHLVDHAATHADALAHFRPHAGILGVDPGTDPPGIVVLNSEPGGLFRHLWAEPTQFVKMEWVDDPLRPRRPTDWGPTFWGGENAAPGRLTPGTLKLYGARLMARGGDVAQAMADQIDFEWESRRWAEPPGDAEASSNRMGC